MGLFLRRVCLLRSVEPVFDVGIRGCGYVFHIRLDFRDQLRLELLSLLRLHVIFDLLVLILHELLDLFLLGFQVLQLGLRSGALLVRVDVRDHVLVQRHHLIRVEIIVL